MPKSEKKERKPRPSLEGKLYKGYSVTDGDELHDFVFARSDKEARLISSVVNEGGCPYIEAQAKRRPEMDDLLGAPRAVIVKALIERCGWWWTCHECNKHVTKDDLKFIRTDTKNRVQVFCTKCVAKRTHDNVQHVLKTMQEEYPPEYQREEKPDAKV